MSEMTYLFFLYQARKRKGELFCMKLRELSGLSAETILEKFGETNKHPVNIEKILQKLGIESTPIDFSLIENANKELVERRGHILGAVTLSESDVHIYYSSNPEYPETRKRFTLAHELAHCCLNPEVIGTQGHIEFRFDEANLNDMNEVMANRFAGKLLVPKDELIKVYDEMIVPLSDVLAKEFNVGRHVMEARLKDLELPFYSPT